MAIKEITTGQDSFLDIVANLVGVLIILVVVVGAQAKVGWQPTEPIEDLTPQLTELKQSVTNAAEQALRMEADNHSLQQQIQREVTVNLGLGELRHQMLVQIQIVEQQLAKERQQRREQLTATQQAELDRQTEQRQLEIQLAEIKAATNAVSAASQPKTEVIEHYPNPIAKTVFAEEVHFQLRGGKLAYVPLEELVSRMKADWKGIAEKFQPSSRMVQTVGPIQNFRLEYELESETVTQATSQGVAQRQAIRFAGFSLLPSSNELGLSVTESLSGSSEFQDVLRRYPPNKTTVSLWIYPDSYTEYNELKKWLYENGYQIACWPLDMDKRIAGGPNGFRTSAQ